MQFSFQLISAADRTETVITVPNVSSVCSALAPDVQSLTRQACRRGTSRVLPGSPPHLPSLPLSIGLGREGRPGLYGAEWMKKSKPQQALLCQSIKRSGGTAAALIMRQTRVGKGAGLRGGRAPPAPLPPAHELIKRH